MEIFRTFRFEAAHSLPNVPPGHQCGRMHGHSYGVDVHVAGPLDPRLGWVVDFAEIDEAFAPVLAALDHRTLNDVDGLANPTCEHLAVWIWHRLRARLPGLSQVVVRETPRAGCAYRGEPVTAPRASAARTRRRRPTRGRPPTR
jgi:6-pyruvoyltetrahydropterin/6-carboxytetrahydropterin synthase